MVKIIFKMLLLTVIVFILDRIIGTAIYYVYVSSSTSDKRLLYVLDNKVNADVLILGSSRAARNIIAEEMQNITMMTTYNLGYPGSNIDFHEFLLRAIINKKYFPKYIILLLDDDVELIDDETINFRFDILYPLINHHNNFVLNEMINRDIYESKLLVKYSKIYTSKNLFYSLMSLSILFGNNALNVILNCGSMPISIKSKNFIDMKYIKDRQIYAKNKESKYLYEKYMSFVNLCQLNNIKLIVIFPPNFKIPSVGFINRIKSISSSNITFIDYSFDTIVDKEYYYDNSHFDYAGAQLFTKILGNDFNEIKKGHE